MLTPLVLWALTGTVFLIKPGYSQAYEQLSPRLFPIDQAVQFNCPNPCTEARLVRTILGQHLLVREDGKWVQRDPATLEKKAPPPPEQLSKLIQDAIGQNQERYGNVKSIAGNQAHTDTDVVITLDWDSLTLRQEGADTRLLNTLYRIHYLQWSGSKQVDKVLGVSGLVLLATLTLLGIITWWRGRRLGRG